MIDVRAEKLLQRQEGVVATWQLRRAGLTRGAALHLVGRMRRIHDGVYVSGHAPLTDRQRWWAAVLTAPGSVLAHASAAAAHGIRENPAPYEVVVRPGCGGPQRHGDLLVCRTKCLDPEDVVYLDGLPVTAAARTILDLIPYLDDPAARRLVREGLRIGATTPEELRAALDRHRGRRGAGRLRDILHEYAPLPAQRTRSDPELLALAILRISGRPLPDVNVEIAGEEADLSWPDERVIIELDGPSFHRFPTEDARKDRAWRDAGWTVHRLPTDDVYERPERLLALAPR